MSYELKGGEEIRDGVLYGWTGPGEFWGRVPVQPSNLTDSRRRRLRAAVQRLYRLLTVLLLLWVSAGGTAYLALEIARLLADGP